MLVANTDNNKRDCEFSEETVAYLFGELEDSKKAEFSSHLENCADCAAGLTSFSSIHSSIQNWKTAKFDNLSTPVIEIPWNLKTAEQKISVSGSWLGNLREIFSFPHGLIQFGAFAAVLICLGFGLYFLKSSAPENIATEPKENQIINNVLSTPETEVAKIENFDSNSEKEKNSKESGITKLEDSDIKTSADKEILTTGGNLPVKVSAKPANKNIIQKSAFKNSIRGNRSPKNENNFPNDIYGSVPRLNTLPDEADDEDLRLADLFDEIDTR